MLDFICNNIATIIIGLAVLSGIVLLAIKLIKDKKNGRTSCSCGCSNCAMKDICHSTAEEKPEQ